MTCLAGLAARGYTHSTLAHGTTVARGCVCVSAPCLPGKEPSTLLPSVWTAAHDMFFFLGIERMKLEKRKEEKITYLALPWWWCLKIKLNREKDGN